MVKEKLRKALEDAVGYYNDGLSANDAVVKSASEHDLTADQADRVVESFNTAKTINYFDKNASDRTGKFDLASKKDVTLSLFGKMPEKSAGARPFEVDPLQSFYMSAPDTTLNRKHLFEEKRADFLDFCAKVAEARWEHGYSDSTFNAMASDVYSDIKSAEDDANAAAGVLESHIVSAVEKIARTISSAPYGTQRDVADLFKAACPHKSAVDMVSEACPILKSATGGRYAKDIVVDTSPVDDILKEAEGIAEAESLKAEYLKKREMFAKKAEDLRAAMLGDPSVSPQVKKASRPESMLHYPSRMSKSAASGLSSIISDPVDSMSDVADTLTNIDSRKTENEAIMDEQRGAMLADLLSSDPILQDADPRQVAAVYKSVVQSSPRVSLNKEVVRSVLRSAVNSIAFSPNDMKVLTDVDYGINKAYGGNGSKGDGDDR